MTGPDLLLVSSPSQADYRYSSLALRYLSAVLRRAGFRVDCLDACFRRMSLTNIAGEVLRAAPRVLGLSVLTPQVLKVLDLLRQAGFSAPVVLGGHAATFNAQRLLERWPQVTCVVRGEGELTMLELLPLLLEGADISGVKGIAMRTDGQVLVGPSRPLISDLDWLPLPDMDILARDHDPTAGFTLTGSRGCFGSCGFCSVQSFYGLSPGPRWRGFSVGRVLEEIEYLVRRFGAKRIWFLDDQFIGPGEAGRRRTIELAEGILARGFQLDITLSSRPDTVDEDLFRLLRRAGVTTVLLGVESGVDAQLARLGKNVNVEQNVEAILTLASLGIDVRLGWIMLDPQCTLDEYEANLNFLEAFDPRPLHRVTASLDWLYIYPGTPLERTYCLPRGLSVDEDLKYSWEFEDPRLTELVRAARAWLNATRPRRQALIEEHQRNATDVRPVEAGLLYAREYFTFLRSCLARLRGFPHREGP